MILKINYSNTGNLTSCCWEIRNCPSVLQAMYCFTILKETADVIFASKTKAMELSNAITNAIMIFAKSATKTLFLRTIYMKSGL